MSTILDPSSDPLLDPDGDELTDGPTAGDYADAVLALGPQLYLRLDQTGIDNPVDSSTYGRAVTMGGSYTWGVDGALTTDPTNTAINLTGDAAILLPSHLGLSGSRTYLAWVRTTASETTSAYDGDAPATVIGDSSGGVWEGFGLDAGAPSFRRFNGSTWQTVTGATAVNDGDWHLIAVTYDSSSRDVTIYADGDVDGTGTISTHNAQGGLNQVGRGYDASDAYDGDLDEVAVFDFVLTDEDIAGLFASGAGEAPEPGDPQTIAAASAISTAVAYGSYIYTPGTEEPQTLVAASAIEGPVAYGALLSRAGDFTPRLAAALYHRSDLNTPLATLDNAWGRNWQEILSEAGSGGLMLGNEDTDLALVGPDTFIRFTDDGWAAFCVLIDDIDHQHIAEGEEHDQVTKISGPGHIAMLAEALVWPSRGVGVYPIEEDRYFNWTSNDYNDLPWVWAHSIAGVFDDTPAWYGMREGWPVGSTAQWIGPSMGTTSLAPGGTNYFRRTFNVPDLASGNPIDITIYFVADDTGELYLDGQSLISAGQWGNSPSDVYTAQAQVTPGLHLLAVSVYNSEDGPAIVDGEPFNPTAFVCAVHTTNPDGTVVGIPLVTTDSDWRIVEYPPGPPGMTPGEVIRHVIGEAQWRGCLPYVSFNFTAEVDSAGKPWPVTADISTKVGYDLWTFFKELAATYVDLWMEPASFRLWAWNKGTRGQTKAVTLTAPTDPMDPSTGNLLNLAHHTIQ